MPASTPQDPGAPHPVATQQPTGLDGFIRELDVLVRARYPLLAVSTFEELRFRRVMHTLAGLERHRTKGLYVWTRTTGLRQVAGPGVGGSERPAPDTDDPVPVLEHFATP